MGLFFLISGGERFVMIAFFPYLQVGRGEGMRAGGGPLKLGGFCEETPLSCLV